MKGGHDVPITKIISRYSKSILNCCDIAQEVDRLYVYDNSANDMPIKPLFGLSDGILDKMYVNYLPNWARNIIPEDEIKIQNSEISD